MVPWSYIEESNYQREFQIYLFIYLFRILLYINRVFASLFVDQDRMLSGSVRGKKKNTFAWKN